MFGLNYVFSPMGNLKPILIGVISLALFSFGWYINGSRWSLKYDRLVTQHKEEILQAEREARKKELVAQALVDTERRDKDAKIYDLNSKLSTALNELRQRPTRESNSKSTCDCKGANGSKLFREDAHFLTREAARADRAVIALQSCYASYDKAREILNEE